MRMRFLAGLIVLLMGLSGGSAAWADSADPASGAVDWQVGSTLFLAGRDYNVARRIDGSLTATGQTISITNETTITKDAWIAGRHVAVEGTVNGDLTIRSEDALINGVVKGDVSFYGVSLSFGPDARVEGNVDYFSVLPATLDKGAQILGKMDASALRDAPPEAFPRPDYRKRFDERDRWVVPDRYYGWWAVVVFAAAAGLISALWPRSGALLVEAGQGQTVTALIYGFLWYVLVPIVAFLAVFTIIGLPLAIILVFLFPLTVLAGLLAFVLAVGSLIDRRITFVDESFARRLAGIIVATFLLRLGASLPGLGTLVWAAAISYGMGVLFLAARSRV